MTGPFNEKESPSPEEVRETCSEVATEAAAAIAHAGQGSEGWEYEVFLSFRGADTRTNFTDFLYEDLVRAGIRAYRDDDELSTGKKIGVELFKGIKQSKIYIPIFSQHYAHSTWCLRELTDMVKYSKKQGRVIIPIFYDVDPGDVKHQTGKFTDAFHKHENEDGVEKHTIREWKEALRYVAELKGWEVKKRFDKHQGRLVKKLVSDVSERLNIAFLDITENLVGIDDQAEEVMTMLDTDHTSDVKIVGIYGMAGIGKTTLAKYIYNKVSDTFQHSSFLADVKEISKSKGIEKLQKQLISDILGTKISNSDQAVKVISERFRTKKALILIDDVDHSLQLQMIARKHEWFCPGSKIIITTRNKQVLDEFDIKLHYEVKTLSPENSLRLLSKHAFKNDVPLRHFAKLARDIASTTGGHPLSLRIIGSLLHNKDEKMWLEILKKLKDFPDMEVLSTLKLSYEALEQWQQEMFLDVACFFIGFDKSIVSYMWESCNYYPEYGVAILINMSLVKVDMDGKLVMHDHLKDLGRKIVKEKTRVLGKPTRLWSFEEFTNALKGNNVGVDSVQALRLGNKNSEEEAQTLRLTTNDLNGLCNLMYFQAGCADIHSDFKGILPELRWLQWSMHVRNPWTSTLSKLCPRNLVILDLSNSTITEWWRGWKLMKDAKKLKVLNLSHCKKLKKIPKFPKDAILERLILKDCTNLVNLHPSVMHLNSLVLLELSSCESLESLPLDDSTTQISHSTWTIDLSKCSKPSTTSFRERQDVAPLIEEGSSALQVLNLSFCRCIHSLTESIEIYEMLIKLDLGHTMISTIPDSIGALSHLEVLIIRETIISEFPDCIWSLQKLEVIDAYKCKELRGEIPPNIEGLSLLRILRLGFTKISCIPRSIVRLKWLEELDLSDLKLESLPELPSSLKRLWTCCSPDSRTSHLAKLINLEELELDQGLFPVSDIGTLYKLKYLTFKSYHTTLPSGIGALQRLVTLKIQSSSIKTLPPEIASLPQLSVLIVSDCDELGNLPRLPSSLSKLHLSFCCSLSNLGVLSNLKYLCSLTIDRCPVTEIKGLNELESLTELCLAYCHNLRTLSGLESLTCLTKLYIYCCVLETLPNLSKMKNLKEIYNYGCSENIQIEGIKSNLRICSEPIEEFEY